MRWRIINGLLVSKRGRHGDGYLEIDVRRCPPEEEGWETVHVEVEIASFYPAIATWLTKFVYSQHAVEDPRARDPRLPALARAPRPRAVRRRALRPARDPRGADGSVTVGDTPWGVIAALAAAAVACLVALAVWLRRRDYL